MMIHTLQEQRSMMQQRMQMHQDIMKAMHLKTRENAASRELPVEGISAQNSTVKVTSSFSSLRQAISVKEHFVRRRITRATVGNSSTKSDWLRSSRAHYRIQGYTLNLCQNFRQIYR
ncbi:uncharacterized protein PHALS_07599 [Plasmopara halstedii]|uniref:Uncharacterized protein n=1 Tax=Plasmopara halstedii TaxID=4781 RepID=A0A0N7L8H1_PLAHL|nr:uncharacterized protein PHALS_07599 [Plasmopara halstedii]CEG49859.1 hypothetical protein PHALS_07599 [Plasmopara halstedii]|eukprot:XP_024586228.1 hypothetical protein PHALS_07599 [Plasmopara halstedii]